MPRRKLWRMRSRIAFPIRSATAPCHSRPFKWPANFRSSGGGMLSPASFAVHGGRLPPKVDLAKLNVCFIAGTLGPGGAERQLYYIAKALQQNGAGVRV